ncbi:hypothetical protein D3C80_1919390 [compost metagenome]
MLTVILYWPLDEPLLLSTASTGSSLFWVILMARLLKAPGLLKVSRISVKAEMEDLSWPMPDKVILVLFCLVMMGCCNCACLAATLALITPSRSSPVPAPAEVIAITCSS